MHEKSFRIYIFRLLKITQPGLRITKPAMEAIDSIIRVVAEKLVDKSLFLTANDNKKTISSNELQTATHMILPPLLASLVNDAGKQSINTFETSEENKKDNPPDKKTQTRESKSGLIFSVSASEKYIRRFGQLKHHVTSTCPVFLAAVLETLCKKILQTSGEITQLSKKITITVRHIFLAIKKDQDLNTLSHNLGIVLLEAGVEPQTLQNKHHKRIQKKNTQNTTQDTTQNTENTQDTTENTQKTKHRWRPGTKTIMQIRKLQKNGDTLMQHAPFNRLVRELVKKLTNNNLNIRITGDFFTSLQAFVEDRVIRLMSQSNQIATHTGRETVYSRDVQLAISLTNQKQTNDPCETHIPEAALRQMALRAGIRRFGDCSTDAYRTYITNILTEYLHLVILCTNHHKVQTLNTKLFLEAMATIGFYPSIVARKRKLPKKSLPQTTPEPENQTTPEPENQTTNLSDVEETE